MDPYQKSDEPQGSARRRRTRMVRPYPIHTLEEAVALALAIQKSNAGLPFERALLARAMGTTPSSSSYTMRLNSSARYGLTQGAYNDDRISLTPLGEAIAAPKGVDERRKALVQAAMQPEIFGRFYRMVAGKRLPEDEYAQNVLKRELGVHPGLSAECLGILKANGLYAGIFTQDGDALYVGLEEQAPDSLPGSSLDAADSLAAGEPGDAGRIFIAHSGNRRVVAWATRLLDEFGIPYRVSDFDGKGGRPVSAEASAQMRECTSAILVFAVSDGRRDAIREVTPWMLMQLGAASALYGERVVVLTEPGLELDNDLAEVRSVAFDRDKPEEAGLALLRALHWVGVVKVRL